MARVQQRRSRQWALNVLASADGGAVPVLETVFIDAESRAPSLWVYTESESDGPTTRRRPASELNYFRVRERFTQFAAGRSGGGGAEALTAVAWTAGGTRRVLDDAAFGRLLTDLAKGAESGIVALQPYVNAKPKGGVYRVVSKEGGVGSAPVVALVVRGAEQGDAPDARLSHELELFASRTMSALQLALQEDAAQSEVAMLELEFTADELSDQLWLSNVKKIECLVPKPKPKPVAAAKGDDAEALAKNGGGGRFPVMESTAVPVLSDSESEDDGAKDGSAAIESKQQAQPSAARKKKTRGGTKTETGGRLPSLSGAGADATSSMDFGARDRLLEKPSAESPEPTHAGSWRPKRQRKPGRARNGKRGSASAAAKRGGGRQSSKAGRGGKGGGAAGPGPPDEWDRFADDQAERMLDYAAEGRRGAPMSEAQRMSVLAEKRPDLTAQLADDMFYADAPGHVGGAAAALLQMRKRLGGQDELIASLQAELGRVRAGKSAADDALGNERRRVLLAEDVGAAARQALEKSRREFMRAMHDKEESQKQQILAIESKYHADLAAHSAELPNAGAQAMHRVRSLVGAVNELEQRLAQTKEREREAQARYAADVEMAKALAEEERAAEQRTATKRLMELEDQCQALQTSMLRMSSEVTVAQRHEADAVARSAKLDGRTRELEGHLSEAAAAGFTVGGDGANRVAQAGEKAAEAERSSALMDVQMHTLSNELRYVKSQLESEKRCSMELKDQLVETKSAHAESVAKWKGMLGEQTEATQRDARETEERWARELGLARAETSRLEDKIQMLQSNMTDMVHDRQLARKREESCRADNLALTQRATSLTEDIEGLKSQVAQAHTQLSESQSHVAKLDAAASSAMAKHRQLEAQVEFATRQLELEKEMREQLDVEVGAANAAQLAAEQSLAQFTEQAKLARVRAEGDLGQAAREYQTRAVALQGQVEQLESQLVDLQRSYASTREQLAQHSDALNHANLSLSRREEELEKQGVELARQVAGREADTAAHHASLSVVQTTLAEIEGHEAKKVTALRAALQSKASKLSEMQAEMLRQRVEMVSSASQQQKLRGASSINSVMSRWARRRMGMAWTKWRVNEGCDVMRADMTAAHEEEMNDAMDDANETKARELAQAEAHRLNDLASSEAEKKKSLRETEGMCNADSESALYRAHSAAATAARIAAAELSFTQTEWRKEVEQVTRSAEKVVSQLTREKRLAQADAENAKKRMADQAESDAAILAALRASTDAIQADLQSRLDETTANLATRSEELLETQRELEKVQAKLEATQNVCDARIAQIEAELRASEAELKGKIETLTADVKAAAAEARAKTAEIASIRVEHENRMEQAIARATQEGVDAKREALETLEAEWSERMTTTAQGFAERENLLLLKASTLEKTLRDTTRDHEDATNAARAARAEAEAALEQSKIAAIMECNTQAAAARAEMERVLHDEKEAELEHVRRDCAAHEAEALREAIALANEEGEKKLADGMIVARDETEKLLQSIEVEHNAKSEFEAKEALRMQNIALAQLAEVHRKKMLEAGHMGERDVREAIERTWKEAEEKAAGQINEAVEEAESRAAVELDQRLRAAHSKAEEALQSYKAEAAVEMAKALDAAEQQFFEEKNTALGRAAQQREEAVEAERVKTNAERREKEETQVMLDDTSRKLEESEDLNYDITNTMNSLRQAGSVQRLWCTMLVMRTIRAMKSQQTTQNTLRVAQLRKLTQRFGDELRETKQREDDFRTNLKKKEIALKESSQEVTDLTFMKSQMEDTLMNHKRDLMMDHKAESTVIQADIDELHEQRRRVEMKRLKLLGDVSAMSGNVHTLEDELRELSKTSAIKDGQVDLAHAAKKRRLDKQYKDVLQKLARETTNLKKIEVEQAGIQKQVHSKEDRLKRMEGSLVRALMEQQRKLLTIISSVGRHATVEDVPMSAGAG